MVTLAHLHYGTCVVLEMCGHLGIRPLSISIGSSSSGPDTQYTALPTEDTAEHDSAV